MWIFCLLELSTTKTSLIKPSNTPRKKHSKKEGQLYPSYLKMLVSARICWALGKALIYRPSHSTLKISNTA
ncbi:hypothetical protein C9J47_18240 [Photobacterium indicum]|uniref:Uncharacterized protein n=1 Tax=Photobacterium indicum TaxID=81447 RepID=A0A2T3L5R2_9GAMM|nr:hypothetical protein C9J47_18240 [Photobacterium indicum]